MKATSLLSSVCAPLALALAVQAQTLDSSLSILDDKIDFQDTSNRVRFAKVLLKEVEAIFDSIPNVSPDQNQWLTAERERIDKLNGKAQSDAQMRFLASKELRLERAKQGFRNIRTLLRGMESMENRDTALHGWVLLAYQLTDDAPFKYLEWLQQQKVVTLIDKLRHSDLGDEGSANIIGRGILRNIVAERARRLELGK